MPADPRHPSRPATTAPAPRPRASGPRPQRPTTGPRGPRPAGDLTGKPRVDWATYDEQAALEHTTDPEWILYRAWATVPIDGRWWVRAWQHLLAAVLGPVRELLWIGISMRAGIARATEHLADKHWRRQIIIFEIDETVSFNTEASAETYEEERIRTECPRHNSEHNERAFNAGATHRRKRIQAHHIADWHSQASLLALQWLLTVAVHTPLLLPDEKNAGSVATAVGSAFLLAAAALQLWRIISLWVRGNQLSTAQRNRINAKRAARIR